VTTTTATPSSPHTLAALFALTRRALDTCRRTPSLVVGPVMMSAFFLVIYNGQLAETAGVIVPDGSYVSFLLPLVLLTTAFSGGAIAGQLLLRDLDSRYHACLALTPAKRGVLAAAPTLAGIIVITAQAVSMILLAWAMGLDHPHGIVGIGVVLGLTTVAGTGFLLLAATAALVGRTVAAVSMVTYVFFPLSFLTTTLVPREQLSGWMGVAADLNPLTYLLGGMRDALSPGWSGTAFVRGGVAATLILALGLVAVSFGLRSSSEEVDR